MALQPVSPCFMPQLVTAYETAAPYFTGQASTEIDAATERYAVVFRAPKSGNISKVGFRTEVVTAGDDNGIEIKLETVSAANGDPTGTLVTPDGGGGGSMTSQAIADGDDNTWFQVTLDEVGAVVAGEIYAVVFDYPNYTDGDMRFAVTAPGTIIGSISGHIYTDLYSAAAWVKTRRATLYCPAFYLGYDDGSFPFLPSVMAADLGEWIFNDADTPDEIGLQFQMDVPARLLGVVVSVEVDAVCDVVFYDTDGPPPTPLETWPLDPDQRPTTGYNGLHLMCTTPRELTAAGVYRVTVKPTSGVDVALPYMDNTAIANLLVWEAMGIKGDFYHTAQVGGGGFTPNTSVVPFIQLILDQFDDGAGAGGGTPNLLHGSFG